MQILVVCSANRCRSPMGAALLGARLGELGVAAEVKSTGFGPPGQPAEPEVVAVMVELGLDLSDHRSRPLDLEECQGADLIVGMTRQHVVGVATVDPSAWPRAFPLVDLVDRARQMDPLGRDEPVGAWVRRAHGGRTTSSVLALPADVDIADPIGEPLDAYRRTRDQLVDLTHELARFLSAGGGGASTPPPLVADPITWDGWGP